MSILITYFSIGEGDAAGTDVLQEYEALKKSGFDVHLYADI